jgi:3-isopropylmalate/(R)-2-methylmalate dehydratase small subunit
MEGFIMTPFTTHTGIVATLNRANVDTDAIIPKQFLKSVKRTGYGPNAFFDWRYTPAGEPNPDFELNQQRFEGRSILVTRNNFGCGSSREHAVWALVQDGYRAIIAPGKEMGEKSLPAFADIFRINAAKNGLLVIELSEDLVDKIFGLVETHLGLKATIDLDQQQIVLQTDPAQNFGFDIEPDTKERLLNGMDDIAQTLQYETDIARFEENHDTLIIQG